MAALTLAGAAARACGTAIAPLAMDMAEEPEPEIQNKVVYERVTNSGTSKQNIPVIIAVVVLVAIILYFVLGKYS